jgi:hypothetical protein
MKQIKNLFINISEPDENGVWPSMFHSGKTKQTHPYNYDPFFILNIGEKAKEAIYTDRLYSWNHKKHDELCKKHFGNQSQYWNNRDPEAIQEFLKDWTENPDVKLVFIIEYCNMSNGYPCWCLGFTY